MIAHFWDRPATIERNSFVYKSLSSWSYNVAVGCNHACRFCYVPEVSTRKGAMAKELAKKGVADPDEQWGDYVFIRQWDGPAFLRSLEKAERLLASELNADGNRAVMLCTTTDPYQVVSAAGPVGERPLLPLHLNSQLEQLVNGGLHFILERSSLNVRILTRSPLARQHFYIFKKFEKRLLFGMSIPTLNNQLARIYEPKAPAPSQRLETLRLAKEAGLNIYVAVAPTYPECDSTDMERTLRAIVKLDPVTIFMEPINIRAQNVQRIAMHAAELGVTVNTAVFDTPATWAAYAADQLLHFEMLARLCGVRSDQLHLWPDKALARHNVSEHWPDWLQAQWSKVSAWPR